MSHDSYLINLGAPDPENLRKSRAAFKEELERCIALGITFLNFHPGSALQSDVQECLDTIVNSLLMVEELIQGSQTTLILETTAGQGSSVGHRFEQIAYILDKVKNRLPIGVCIDTCHIFTAGYDIRTPAAWEETLNAFDQTIGLPMLRAFHVNDSVKGLGSKVDRHSQLGQGQIGLESFKFLMKDSRTQHIPKYLETPDPAMWKQEIQMLRDFAAN
jgi:deoxyribonuclease-4